MTEPKDNVGTEQKGVGTILYDFFRSLKLTISLLILLAILSIIGTLITQNAAPEEYIQRYGPGLYEVFDFFGLFDMYHSWWFSAVLVLLVINLIACSADRFPGVWRQTTRGVGPEGLTDSFLRTLPFVERLKGKELREGLTEEYIRSLFSRSFRTWKQVEKESEVTLFAEKGKFSRLGVYLTHLSILIILIGGLIGSRYGFHGFVNILEGESVDHIFLRRKGVEIPKPIGFLVRCDDFSITFYDIPGEVRHVKEYTSFLTILEDGKEVLKGSVRVNHPLHYRGWAFYQSSYGTLREIALGVEWKSNQRKTILKAFEGDTVSIPETNTAIRVLQYSPQVHAFGEGVQVALFRPGLPPQGLWLFRKASDRNPQQIDTFSLSFEGSFTREYTGLQVAKDPGVWIVWIGSGLLILGLIISFFFSHQRVWVKVFRGDSQRPREIILAGTASKNRLAFEKQFQRWTEMLRSGDQA